MENGGSIAAYIILLLCYVGLVIPISAFCYWILYNDWDKTHIVKRHRILVLIGTLSVSIAQFSFVSYSF